MTARFRCLVLVVLALTFGLSAARAENPKVSLKVENATCAEAVAALSKASGVAVELYSAAFPAAAPPALPGLDEKASFDWSDLTFARALRQLCERYQLYPNQRQGGYILYPSGAGRPAAPAKRVGLVEKNGVRLFVRGVGINMTRRVSFLGDQPGQDDSHLSLELGCEMGDGDAAAIAGVDNVSARDDTGNVMFSEVGRSFGLSRYPDEWQGGVTLSGIPARAKKLEWIEGDLIVYKRYHPRRVEFPLPLPAEGASKRVGETIVELTRFDPVPAAGEPPALRVPGIVGPGPRIQLRVAMPRPDDGRFGNGTQIAPMLVGASGRTYWQYQGGTNGRGSEIGMTYEINAEFQNVPEPVTRVLVQWEEKSQPVKLFTFRMENVPLPPEGVAVPRRTLPPPRPRPVAAPGPERPYEEKGGGILLNRIQIQERPAPEGTLSLGLALKTGAEWSTIRWQDLDVEKDGLVRLPDLKPGIYRLIRIYRPKDAQALAAPGRWLNGEVQVDLAAGKETTAPPLRWAPAPQEKKPAAPARPTPRG